MLVAVGSSIGVGAGVSVVVGEGVGEGVSVDVGSGVGDCVGTIGKGAGVPISLVQPTTTTTMNIPNHTKPNDFRTDL